jgi:hypothetical protein
MIIAEAAPLLDNLALPAGITAVCALGLVAYWLVPRGKPDPQHERRRFHDNDGLFLGVMPGLPLDGSRRVAAARYVASGEPDWDFPPRHPDDRNYEGDSDVIEAGRARVVLWLLGEWRTPFTR